MMQSLPLKCSTKLVTICYSTLTLSVQNHDFILNTEHKKNLITFNSPAKVWNSQRRLRNFLIKGVIETKTSCFLLSRKNYTEITQIVEKLVE